MTRISRDGNGTVTITAANDADSARALGYVHAQERYFEMDLLRRSAAGELSALVRQNRHRKRQIHPPAPLARAHPSRTIARDDRFTDAADILQAYADGVNAGLADLSVKALAVSAAEHQARSVETGRFLFGRVCDVLRSAG